MPTQILLVFNNVLLMHVINSAGYIGIYLSLSLIKGKSRMKKAVTRL